ncbi:MULTISPECIES: MBOAT family O-acyltransferase [unclassified Oscillibacter]|uniref:MBOAT family O-acyltransferase n=1 Tax=unclassified Oscillibacter TaxID=2629304 RepID=UPI0025D3F20B|nr:MULTISPECIES: MBOAT family O-acyltransferase [unclassified Oscillibacter]
MVFSSPVFLFFYLPVSLALYFVVPLKWRNLVLLAASLLFYGWGEGIYVLIMLLSTAIDYTHGLLVEKYRNEDKKARWFVAQSVIFNLLILGFFKYYNFIAVNLSLIPGLALPDMNVHLPIGVSFYTFQTMSYTIDVYRKDAPVQRNVVAFGTFVTMFPQLIAGPIVKYKQVALELNSRRTTAEGFARGVLRFTVGLAKKVLLANAVGVLWETQLAAQSAGTLTAAGGWLGLAAFSLQIYFDFSGYSDMAIGLGYIFGFHFPENFDHPYLAKSVTEFWRRWHMSLTGWFREYVYIPLGGNRGGEWKTLRNILIVWTLTGIWHGASWNFLLWGEYFAAWLILEKYVLGGALSRAPVAVQRIYTLMIAAVGWGLFAIEDLGRCAAYLKICFGGGTLWSAGDGYLLRSYGLTLVILAFASTTLGLRLWVRLPERVRQIAAPLLMLAGLTVCTAYLVDNSYNPFLYFRF